MMNSEENPRRSTGRKKDKNHKEKLKDPFLFECNYVFVDSQNTGSSY